jgi:hypothetical protein
MLDIDTVLGWRGKTVRDRDGEKAGTLGAIYLDGETDAPAYAGVLTGLFRRNESVVPLEGAREVDGDVQVPYAQEQIRSAPNVDPDVALSDDEESRLLAHYGGGEPEAATVRTEESAPRAHEGGGEPEAETIREREGGGEPEAETVREREGGGEPEAEMVRSEERVDFGVAPARPKERVRLKKYTVTEQVEKTVPVRREEIRLEHDPPPEGGRIVDVEDA